MTPSVVIKTNAYGLNIFLDPVLPFEQLQEEVASKFRNAAKFFKNAKMAVTFKGRELSEEEEYKLISTITENSSLQIVCLVDETDKQTELYKEAITRTLKQQEDLAQVFRGTVTNGMRITSDKDLLILGDVNPGGEVITSGNLIVIGCVMGAVTAGCGGRRDAFVAALILKPSILHLADKAGRSAITKRQDTGEYSVEPKIARIKEDHLVIEKLNSSTIRSLLRQDKKE